MRPFPVKTKNPEMQYSLSWLWHLAQVMLGYWLPAVPGHS
jgi:hypothetical protein